ncbi:deoxynucleoside triphosphate triphosphohydrolase SAMHD1-like [Littorina saxatilis]|uniref:deoxynucleoside triphosphate triphosphohydrolase SAMHD1-like n=1 Tax=Littorina saxatilis TaxID=31220 RepID=UPI0038B670AD
MESESMSPLVDTKVFNDPIHGHMEFPGLCVKIIDTPQFQRLRYLKQLGAGYFVYPDASHNRFEHSLGVCHLAGLLVTELRVRQGLGITDKDILCVSIAGLCHDLGHGPFSHVFDNKFIPAVKPDSKWKHEDASMDMFDQMIEKNDLDQAFKGEAGLTDLHREFIKALIMGKPKDSAQEKKLENGGWYKKEEKAFLYEIVANKRNGVDVDKWDYFQRDCHHLGMTSSFDLKRFIKFARVIKVKGEYQICYRDKEAFNMYQLFHTRFTLHRRAYQHKTVQAVELMLVDAMKAANVFLKIPGDNNSEYSISECIGHMDAYTNLTDEIFHQIMLSKEDRPLGAELTPEERAKELARAKERALARKRAQETLQDIQQRKLYRCVGEIVIPVLAEEFMPKSEDMIKETKKPGQDKLDAERIRIQVLAYAERIRIQENPEEVIKELILKETKTDKLDERIRIQVSKLDYGNNAKNPVNNVRFFKKNDQNKAVEFKAVEVSFLVPQLCFMEHLVRVFFKTGADDIKSDEKKLIAKLQTVCQEWCAQELKKRTEDLEESPPPVPVDLGSNFIKGKNF